MFKFIKGGVCAPAGFRAAGVHAGIRRGKNRRPAGSDAPTVGEIPKKDLALIVSDVIASSAAVYTQNLVKGAPILVTKENLQNGRSSAIICNSGIANTCAPGGIQAARDMCAITAEALGISAEDVIVASTGVIGQALDITVVAAAMNGLAAALSPNGGTDAAQAIMTTDTIPKEMAVSVDTGAGIVKIGGIAKGSGMINPNMATMLSFITTDADIQPRLLSELLKKAADISFNRVSIDGDTSTNDMLAILANGRGGVKICADTVECERFAAGLNTLCTELAKLLAGDGEGATKLIECSVTGAPTLKSAAKAADGVINSPLVKTAMFAGDANWGRILCALGYSGAEFDPALVKVVLRSGERGICVCENGVGVEFSESRAADILKGEKITIDVYMNQGEHTAAAWGCDLSYDYVKINGDYRT